jgi:tetratricopeptide (TPR) repeat protein
MKNKLFNKLAMIAILLAVQTCVFAQQASPEEFLRVLDLAQAKSRASEWAAAVPLWERVVATNPQVAGFWYLLGTAQRNAGEYRKAIPSLEKSLDLGAGRLSVIALDIARSYAGLKDKEMTLKWIERSLDLGFRTPESIRTEATFAFLRDDSQFKKVTKDVDVTRMSRTEGWRYDLTLLETEIKRMHYRPFRKVPQAQFESESQRLRSDVPSLTDNQIAVRIMRLMAMIGDGHTGLFPDLMSGWNGVPMQFNQFEEGLYITAADPKYADLVGNQVLRIGESTPEQLVKAVAPVVSKDSEQAVTRAFGDYIRYPQLLNGLGLQSQSDRIVLTVRGADGKIRTAEAYVAPRDPDFSRIAGHPKWVTVFQNSPDPLPLYLKDRRSPYWFETLRDQPKTLYFQFNLVVNSQTETLQQFLDRLFKFIDENQIDKLIIDMRWNNGGNTLLLQPLINGLIRHDKLNQTGKLFVIIGRYTFSAAINAAASINANTNAIFVGEPTPTGPNFVGESNIITLPYSKLRVSISDLYWQNTWTMDTRTWLAPLLYVPVTFEAYKSKRDPALETILAYPNAER